MAAAGGAALRLRLLFDYPPPGSPGCALCWLLLEPSQVRLVTDLISLIRHRFGFSRRARLSLFLDGALLPPTESARLVRDNDSLRVKLEEVVADEYEKINDDFSYALKGAQKKHRPKQEEDQISRNEDNRHKKEKKKNKHIPEHSSCQEETSVDIWDSQKRYRKRKRKEEASGRKRPPEGKEESSTDQSKKLKKMEREKQLAAKKKAGKQAEAATAIVALEQTNGKSNTKKPRAQPRKKRAGSSDSSSTSSDSDSSEADIKQKKSSHKAAVAAPPKGKSQAAANAGVRTVVSNKVTVKANRENATKTAVSDSAKQSQAASSDSDSSTEEEKVAAAQDKAKSLPTKVTAVKPSATKAAKAKSSSSDSDSSDSDTLVIKKPTANAGPSNSLGSCTNQLPTTTAHSCQGPLASQGRGRGRGTGDGNFWRGPRGRGFRGMTWGRGRGPNPGFFYNYSSEGQKQEHLNEAATNASVLAQDPLEVPRRDYSVLPLLAAPPQVGERIAFKRLELTENYSPEVSDYKEGKIISWNAEKKQIELEILSAAGQSAKEPGKFDLVYQSADGAELIEYAVPQDTKITESWDALIEPRLIVEPPVNGSSVANGTV